MEDEIKYSVRLARKCKNGEETENKRNREWKKTETNSAWAKDEKMQNVKNAKKK